MKAEPLVSIIMAAFNAQAFIGEAIDSVITQTHLNWELIIVNDGSKDNTLEIINSFKDKRIKVFSQENKGVSAARNLALKNMKGEFFCFLDADDAMPINGIKARLEVFNKDQKIVFVDGVVRFMDAKIKKCIRTFTPSFRGNPFSSLVNLDETCFSSLSWMIRAIPNQRYVFEEGLTHGEDLLFLIHCAQGGFYDYTNEEVLHYRKGHHSAMKNIEGLEKGYIHIFKEINKRSRVDEKTLVLLKKKMALIMLKSFFKQGRFLKGIRSYQKIIKLK